MLDFSFCYKDYKIFVFYSAEDNLYHVKCVDEGISFCVIHDFTCKCDCFSFLSKLISFIDILV